MHAYVLGLEFVRLVTCAGANTARNPPAVTDVALRKPRRQSSLERDEGNDRRSGFAQPDWVEGRAPCATDFTVSGQSWGMRLG